MTHVHNVGDFVYFEFNLVQIKEMKGPNIQTVNDGLFSTSGKFLNDRVRLLTMRNKIISEAFEKTSEEIHDLNNNKLNYPDIHNKLVELWIEACDIVPSPPKEEELQAMYERVRQFKETIIAAWIDDPAVKAEGISVYKTVRQQPHSPLRKK